MNLYQPTITGSLEVSGSVGISGSLTINGGTISGTASLATTASYAVTATSATSASYAASASNALSASNASAAATASYILNAVSASYANNASAAANSTLFNSTASAVFATTGSNTLTGVQYISNTNDAVGFSATTSSVYTDGGLQVTKNAYFSSSMFVKGNLTVYGTQSVSFITSSQLNISTNLITVNTDTPSIRFGGLAVYDSGSTGLTGSILWDSQNNHWVYTNPSGSSYSGGMLISGPRASSLGEEQGTTLNAIMKGMGGDHITSSIMFESASLVGIGTATPLSLLDVNLLAGGSRRLLVNYDDSLVTIKSANTSATAETLRIWGDNIYFYTGSAGSELMRLTNTGKVGIGTTNPGAKLEVVGVDENILKLKNASGQPALVRFNDTSTTADPYIGSYGNSLAFGIYGVGEAMRIDSSRNVGIGTTSPSGLLHLSNTNPQLFITNTQGGSSYYMTVSPSIGFNIYESGVASWFTIKNGGNVGIGTTNPNNNLHIFGSGAGLNLSGGNNRIYFGSARAIEGDGTQLQIGEGHAKTFFQTSTGGTVMAVTGSSVGIGTTNPSANLDVNGSMRSISLYGKAYSQTSSTGTTSIIDTAITSDNFGSGAIYAISWGGNPNAAGSNYYFPHFGYIGVNTTYNGNVVKSIGYTSAAAFDGYTTLTLSVVFWDGSSEVSTIGTNDTTSQIRLKISGYNSSYIGVSQAVFITKIH